ncbi:PH domain-containing protein [Oceanobacillus sp. CAU 1775]
MYNAERLHPATIILNVFRFLKDSLFLLVIAFVTFELLTFVIVGSLYILLMVVIGAISWYRYSYWVDEDALHMEYGVFRRTKRTISKNRIQSIDLTQNIIHRLFKLTKVQIETASTGLKAEAALAAVTYAKGIELREQLKYRKTVEEDETEAEEENEEVKKQISFNHLLLAGVTSGGVGIILSFLLVGLSELEEFIPESIYDVTFEWFLSTSIITALLLILVILVFVWMLSVGWTLIRYGNFTISRVDDELLVTRGLLERKQLTIPMHRIQAIGIEENILRQPFSYVSIVAEIAGGSTDKQTDASVILFPIMEKNKVQEFLNEFVPSFSWDIEESNWKKPPKKALKFYILRSGFLFLVLSIALFYFLPAFSWAGLLIFALALYRGWMSYQDAGFDVAENRLLLRYRVLKRVTVLLYPKRIQAFEQAQHRLQRRDKLSTMRISIISSIGGKHYRIRDLNEAEIDDLNDLYYSKKPTSQKALTTDWNRVK